ncbi:DinB family protein [Edaphocola aurantiacus]|uniref:DinB family protein n=1 Tax=Edaphocola aurantiacus TaxID=2601682 RepID=UPI001C97FDBA|nr:DinB family protein [Edaphocola aurantiacus]
MMNDQFAFALTARRKFAQWVEELSTDQLNTIPEHFKNNIAWHLGHIVVSTEILCYYKTGVDPERVIEGVEKYRHGTRPEAYIPAEEITRLKDRLVVSLEEISADYAAGRFATITPFQTMTFGFDMDNIDTVLQCCTHHDLLHLGQAGAMSKLV